MQIENPPFLLKEAGAALAVTFYETPVRAIKREEGKPETFVYYKGIMCRIEAPGMKNQVNEIMIEMYSDKGELIKKKIWEYHEGTPIYYVDRFKDIYAKWRERNGSETFGTPLESWPKLDVALISAFKSEGIRSLEQLASVPDTNLYALGMNGRAWRDGAKKRLEEMENSQPFDELKADNANLQAQLEALKNQLAVMQASTSPKKRGRKPRQTEAVAA